MSICDDLAAQKATVETNITTAETELQAATVDYEAALVAFNLAFQDLAAKQAVRTNKIANLNQLYSEVHMIEIQQQMNNCL